MNKLDLVISFDDTGSMSSVRKQVRSQIQSLVEQLFKLIPELRIGIIIHNDYCDRDLVQKLELTSDKAKIIDFVGRSSSNGGGDYKEAYAYVLNQIRQFSWDAPSKLAIVIADAEPHEKGARSAGVTELYDWREESEELGRKLIPIYSIQALGNRSAIPFYEGMARLSNGIKLDLSQFSHVTDYILAIANKQSGTLDAFQDSKPEFKTNLSFVNMFAKLKGIYNDTLSAEYEKKAEMLGRFQVIDVPSAIKIQDFVNNMGLHYQKGKGYYQFILSEEIQPNKEVIFVDKKTGETNFDTKWCREQMGVPYGTRATKSPRTIPTEVSSKYDIFIQSNSYTRKLDPGTKFLYELHKH
jgi:hypothetical protein